MEEIKDKVILVRKQPREYTVNYPYATSGVPSIYKWMGTKGKVLSEREIPREVYEYLLNETHVFINGSLMVKASELLDEDLKYNRDCIENIEEIEESILTIDEIKAMLTTGNQNVLKGKLNTLIKDKPEHMVKIITREVVSVAQETGIDSGAKRKVICDWANLDFENLGDILFDKNIEDLHK